MSASLDLTDAKIGVNQHQDGSGFEFEVTLNDEGNIIVSQGDDMVSASVENWTLIAEAMTAIRRFQTEVAK